MSRAMSETFIRPPERKRVHAGDKTLSVEIRKEYRFKITLIIAAISLIVLIMAFGFTLIISPVDSAKSSCHDTVRK